MSATTWNREPAVRIAFGAAMLGLIAVVWATVAAVRGAPLPPAESRVVAVMAGSVSTPRAPAADIAAAVDNDVFAPDRAAPAVRYRMPNESRASDEPVAEPEKPTVLGTAVATDGRSFATVRMGDGNPTIVHVGDKIGEWTVRAIERGRIVIATTTGARADVAMPKPGT